LFSLRLFGVWGWSRKRPEDPGTFPATAKYSRIFLPAIQPHSIHEHHFISLSPHSQEVKQLQHRIMTDTDSSTPPEEAVSKRDKKKKSKKHKKKRSDSNCSVQDDVQNKSKKDKKRKRASHEKIQDDEASVSSSSEKKKQKKKHKKSKHTHELKNADEKIVSSSAIEFYPQPLKSVYAEKNKKAIAEKEDYSSKTAAGTLGDTITLLLL
jgi:hypothetical protein